MKIPVGTFTAWVLHTKLFKKLFPVVQGSSKIVITQNAAGVMLETYEYSKELLGLERRKFLIKIEEVDKDANVGINRPQPKRYCDSEKARTLRSG